MLTAGGRALPFGDLAKCATAAGADAGGTIQRADSYAGGWHLPMRFRSFDGGDGSHESYRRSAS
jgi:hypothetical protein